MFTKPKCCIFFLLACVCVLAGGCGEKLPPGMPKPYPVTITITQEGAPLEGASISLIPADSANSWSAVGLTDESGKAAFKTAGEYKGVVPGKYYAIVSKCEVLEKAIAVTTGQSVEMNAGLGSGSTESRVISGYDLIDPKFSQFSSQAETIEVQAGKNEKTIEVGPAVRIERIITVRF
jgi:hypothetical protein